MPSPSLEILAPIRAAIIAQSSITSRLGTFQGVASVHTRRPVPVDAEYPMIVIGPIVTRTDNDGINDFRPMVVIDVNTYGEAVRDYRDVETVAEAIYSLFHRQRGAITVTGWSVIQITSTGPSPAPADGNDRVGRRVTLTISLYAK